MRGTSEWERNYHIITRAMEELRSRKVSTMKCSHIVTVVMNKWKFNKTKNVCLRIKMRTFNATMDLSPHLCVSGSKRVSEWERDWLCHRFPFLCVSFCLFHALHKCKYKRNKYFSRLDFLVLFSLSLSPSVLKRGMPAVIAYSLCEIISA